jgi:tetratricopeptide (TPR) repeat protein
MHSVGVEEEMARKGYGGVIIKLVGGTVLLILAVIGLAYGSLLRHMDQAAEDYNRGDVEAALKQYESIEQRLRSWGAMRIIPARDRRNLILNEAQLLYALDRYDDALDRAERENEISGVTTDGRFVLLRGEVTFRKAVKQYRDAAKKDPRMLDEALRAAEDNFRDALRLLPDSWDAKFNFEFINYLRSLSNQSGQGQMKILMENVRVEKLPPKSLTPEQQM